MTTLTPTQTATAAGILRKAADLIRSRGLAKGGLGRGKDGSLCTGHAVSEASLELRSSSQVNNAVWRALVEQVSGPLDTSQSLAPHKMVCGVVAFNDAPETTQERVIKELEAAADAAEGGAL